MVVIVAVVTWMAFFLPRASAQTDQTVYITQVANLTAEIQTLNSAAISTNTDFESATVGINDALAALRDIQARTMGVADSLASLSPPADFDAQHRELLSQADALTTASTGMVNGLLSSDNGDRRRNAAAQFAAAAEVFTITAETVRPPVTTTVTQTVPETTPTTVVVEETTTTTVAPTTTAASTIIVAPEPTDGGGNSWPLVIGMLLVGLLIGSLGGLVMGRQARLSLMEVLRKARAGD